ncbi:YsnF/AvaK domain-containing protein [Pontibacter sp. 172403-2]|uniref:YsnF/AvaK domain-containing protein n=1 Tax=Pontibacter rufus TaxID=2791028 RepID=UPI001E412475|nr:YsnF/AvaK domain-containing protein [Pontibacter sp. 172403-2]
MSKISKEEIQSEFDQKLRESMAGKQDDGRPLQPDAEIRQTAEPGDAEVLPVSEVIPVIEEQIRIDKQVIETGSVHIAKKVHEESVNVDAPTVHEEVSVERVPINRQVEAAPEVRYEGDVTIIPVMREEAVVIKRLVLVEELHITKRMVRTHEQQQVTLRREEVNINREDNGESRPV